MRYQKMTPYYLVLSNILEPGYITLRIKYLVSKQRHLEQRATLKTCIEFCSIAGTFFVKTFTVFITDSDCDDLQDILSKRNFNQPNKCNGKKDRSLLSNIYLNIQDNTGIQHLFNNLPLWTGSIKNVGRHLIQSRASGGY